MKGERRWRWHGKGGREGEREKIVEIVELEGQVINELTIMWLHDNN